jgi:hypothetical protein
VEDWFTSLADYNLTAYAISTPPVAGSFTLGHLVIHKCTAVANKPLVSLGQVLNATITDNYWHNSTMVVDVPANSALGRLEYKRNYLKRGAGNNPQEFYGPILRNNSTTLHLEVLASDFITGNSPTDTANVNFGYGFSGQIAAAKPAVLDVDTLVPFALRYTPSMDRLKVIRGRGRNTGFSSALHSYILGATDLSIDSLIFTSALNTVDTGVGDTAATIYVGGTYTASERVTLRNVTFANVGGVNAVEFGRNLRYSTIQSCQFESSGANKAHFVSKWCVYTGNFTNEGTGGTGTSNSQAQNNAFINTPCAGAMASVGTGNRVL